MLDNIGLSPTTGSYNDGSKYENIAESHGDWNFNFTLNLSPDTTNIWITLWLNQVKDPNNAKASYWYNLLAMQGSLWAGLLQFRDLGQRDHGQFGGGEFERDARVDAQHAGQLHE